MRFLLSVISFAILMLGGVSSSIAADALPADKSAKVETAKVEARPNAKAESVASKNAVNINTADVQELTKLKGIGEKKAEAIIAWRKENGNFKTVEDLLEVKGIGEATLEINRENIRI